MKKFLVFSFLLWSSGCLALWGFYPEFFSSAFPALSKSWKSAFGYNFKLLAISLIGLGLGLGIECFFVGKKRSALFNLQNMSGSTKRDFITCMFHVLNLWPLIGYVTFLGLPFAMSSLAGQYEGIRFIAHIPTDFLKAVTTLFILGFFEYWGHRAFHTSNTLWLFHKYHHTSEEMSVFAAHRNNPFTGPLMSVFTTLPFFLLGGTLGSFAWIGGIRIVHDYLIHSQLKHDWGWVGRWILVSPAAHRVHHSKDQKHYNSNYGFFIIFWDRVFGTYVHDLDVNEFGAEDPVYNKASLAVEMVWPLYQVYLKGVELYQRGYGKIPSKSQKQKAKEEKFHQRAS